MHITRHISIYVKKHAYRVSYHIFIFSKPFRLEFYSLSSFSVWPSILIRKLPSPGLWIKPSWAKRHCSPTEYFFRVAWLLFGFIIEFKARCKFVTRFDGFEQIEQCSVCGRIKEREPCLRLNPTHTLTQFRYCIRGI